MPAKVIVVAESSTSTLDSTEDQLRLSLRTHVQHINRVRVVRRKQGVKVGDGAASREVDVAIAPDENPVEVADATAELVLEILAAEVEAADGEYLGEIQLCDMTQKRESERVVDRITVRTSERTVKRSREDEITKAFSEQREFVKELCKQVVAIVGAAASRETAIASLVEGVAKWNVRGDESSEKYAWKRYKAEVREREHTVEQEANVRTSATRSFLIAGLADKYQPTFDFLARFAAATSNASASSTATAGAPPKVAGGGRPTADEVGRVFHTLRAPVRAEDDGKVSMSEDGDRIANALDRIAKLEASFVRALSQWDSVDPTKRASLAVALRNEFISCSDVLDLLQAALVTALGETRAGEVARWLASPR